MTKDLPDYPLLNGIALLSPEAAKYGFSFPPDSITIYHPPGSALIYLPHKWRRLEPASAEFFAALSSIAEFLEDVPARDEKHFRAEQDKALEAFHFAVTKVLGFRISCGQLITLIEQREDYTG